jgi:steroid delta-isomerase-like uncharacterized protein
MRYMAVCAAALSTLLAAPVVGSHTPPQHADVDLTQALDRHERAVKAFNAQDAEAVADLYATEAVLYDPQAPEPIRGRDAIRESYTQMFRTFPDIQVKILNRHVQGTRMMYELRLIGTNTGPIHTADGDIPATGQRIDVPGAVFADLDGDGRFRETRRYYDVATMMRQLGLEDNG